jgi:hypothetical protein
LEVAVLETITDQRPQLAELDKVLRDLESEQGSCQVKIATLTVRVEETRLEDIDRIARAANSGRRRPPTKESQIREQLAEAEREFAILQRRVELARSERDQFVRDHLVEIFGLLQTTREEQSRKVARSATDTLAQLLELYKIEDEERGLHRQYPPPTEMNTGDPSPHTVLWGGPLQTTATMQEGRRRGDLEQALRYLESLAAPEVTVIEGEGA